MVFKRSSRIKVRIAMVAGGIGFIIFTPLFLFIMPIVSPFFRVVIFLGMCISDFLVFLPGLFEKTDFCYKIISHRDYLEIFDLITSKPYKISRYCTISYKNSKILCLRDECGVTLYLPYSRKMLKHLKSQIYEEKFR